MEKDRIEKLKIEKEQTGTRLDTVLAFSLPEKSRSNIQQSIKEGKVKINGNLCLRKNHLVQGGDVVEILISAPQVLRVEGEDIPLDIVYEDEELLVINKQKGLVVHPGAGNYQGTMVNGLMHHCKDRLSSINGTIRPGIVHRIDKETSGLLVVAKTDKAHQGLAKQLENHTITRRYRALVYNNFKEDEGTVKKPLGRDPNMRLRMAIVSRGGKEAVTHYQVMERFGKYTLIELQLETGRTHQIRVHMASIGHPLVGDYVYGPKKNPWGGVEGQMLQAYMLGFIHPTTGKYMEFQVDMEQEFKKIIEQLM